MFAAHGIKQQRDVLDIARHRALDAEIAIDRGRAYARRGRCSDAGRRCRRSWRDCAAAAHVGAMRQPGRSGCERHRGAAEEPAAEREVSQGLRVAPNTSLKVLAPAPNSGVLDLA